MVEADVPEGDGDRLRAVTDFDPQKRQGDAVFGNIARIAADVCAVEIAAVSVLDHQQEVFLAAHPLALATVPRAVSVCALALSAPADLFEISDTAADPRLQNHPLVAGKAASRFVALQPLATEDGRVIGGLTLFGRTPKSLDAIQRSTLANLAAVILSLFNDRKEAQALVEQRQNTERELSQSEERFRALVDNLPSFVNLKDRDGHYQLINRRHAEIFGFPQIAIQGKRTSEFLPARQAVEALSQERQLLAEKAVVTRERIIEINGEAREFLVTKFPILGSDGEIARIGTIGTDITEMKQMQTALIEAKAEAEAANRRKSEFLADISHDLRTPLNAIIGFSEVLEMQSFGPMDDKYLDFVKDIHFSGEHLLSLINDILDLSAIEAGRRSLSKEAVSIDEVFHDCERIIKGQAKSTGVDVTMTAPDSLPVLYADRRATKQILLNLLSNSIKFTPAGGAVTLAVSATDTSHIMAVRDTGIGIPADKIAWVTDPFVRARGNSLQSKDGAGLGLAIVKSLVSLHDGTLDIKSMPGQGTEVTVTFPSGAP